MWHYIVVFISNFWNELAQMAPYLLLGFLTAGILSVFVSQRLIERHLGENGLLPVIKATVLGIPLPLCSCGVIPVAASLRRHGAGKSATVSFLLSTPQTGIDSILVTYSLLGPVFAVFRPLAALVTGIGGGIWTALVAGKEDRLQNRKELFSEEPIESTVMSEQVCTDGCCSPEKPSKSKIKQALTYGFLHLPQDIGKALLAGLFIAGIISAVVPENLLGTVLGGGIGSMLLMMLFGVPLYVCATASVPVAAALIAKGVSPGTAFVFLMTGPVTNAAAILTIWKILGRKVSIIYLSSVAVFSVAAGLLLDKLFFDVLKVTSVVQIHEHHGVLENASAVILLLILGYAFFRSYIPVRTNIETASRSKENDDMKYYLKIDGMSCHHCTASVERSLSSCPGVTHVSVSLKPGTAEVSGHSLDMNRLISEVEKLGYTVVSHESR